MYLIDSDIFSDVERGKNRVLLERIATVARNQVYISIVTVEEAQQGRLNYVRQREKAKDYAGMMFAYGLFLETFQFLQTFQVQPFNEAALAIFEGYSAATRRAGANDCKIAAIAEANGWIVVTRNTRHFDKIGVAHENWAV